MSVDKMELLASSLPLRVGDKLQRLTSQWGLPRPDTVEVTSIDVRNGRPFTYTTVRTDSGSVGSSSTNEAKWWHEMVMEGWWGLLSRGPGAGGAKCKSCGDENPFADSLPNGLCGSCRSYLKMGGYADEK